MAGEDLGDLTKKLFGENFKWGVSTAAYQIEGAHDCDDKGPSIWDVFTAKKGTILNDDTATTACDFYSTYYNDIQLMKSLNIPNFRFSFAWSRILPTGTGIINQAGIDYYNKVIDACLEAGIEPWATLYHWDLPQALEDKGGWTNRQVIEWFKEFAGVCAKHFGGRVKYWMVMNEPMVFTGAGHFMGVHAPGRKGLKNFLPAVHHAVLSIAEGGRVLRSMLPDAEIGTTFSSSYVEPLSMNPKDIAAAYRADVLLNRLFIEPILGMGYPEKDLPVLKKLRKYSEPGDESLMAFDFDFIGVQSYTREIVKYSLFVPYLNAAIVKAMFRKVPLTTMGWEVYPPSLYQVDICDRERCGFP
jgi:beta-glucosidase